MRTTRFCTLNDYNEIENIIQNTNVLSNNSIDQETKNFVKNHFFDYLSSTTQNKKVIGLYNNNLLKAMASLRIWDKFPFCSINHLYIQSENNSLSLSYYNNGFIEIQKFAQKYTENLQIFEQYQVSSKKTYRTLEKLFLAGLERYHFVIEQHYKQGDIIKYPHHHGLLGYPEVVPWECFISKISLKHEYRMEIIKKQNNE